MNYIHETIIRDIIDLVSDLKNTDLIKRFTKNNISHKSISSASANLTLVFPVLCSKSINIDDASMVTKAIERRATTMLQLLFAAKQTHESENVFEYLKQFHTNLKIDDNITVDSMMSLLNKMVTESAIGTDYILSEYEINKLLKNDMKNINSYLEENISDKSIMSYSIAPTGKYGKPIILENNRDEDADNLKKNKDLISTIKQSRDVMRGNLLDNDIKKANELIPTTLIVNYIIHDGDKFSETLSFIVGIKAKLYSIDSMDIIERLVAKNKDSNLLNKFIRASTREISFVKDFLFAIDQAKVDALSQSKRGSSSKFWKILERRAKKSKLRRNLGMANDAMSITTLVASQEEVNYIKKEDNIDLENPSIVRPIMEAYNLMGFCILDEINEIAKFIFDTGEDVYEHLSFNSLERETSDGGYKKAINLISRLTK